MMNEATDKKVITKQVSIDSKYSSRLLPITADEKVIDIIQEALTELSAIKQVVENWDEGEYYTDSIRSMKKIEDIIKGEGK